MQNNSKDKLRKDINKLFLDIENFFYESKRDVFKNISDLYQHIDQIAERAAYIHRVSFPDLFRNCGLITLTFTCALMNMDVSTKVESAFKMLSFF